MVWLAAYAPLSLSISFLLHPRLWSCEFPYNNTREPYRAQAVHVSSRRVGRRGKLCASNNAIKDDRTEKLLMMPQSR